MHVRWTLLLEHFFPCRPVFCHAVCSLFSRGIVEMCNPVLNGKKRRRRKKGGASFLTFYDCFFALLSSECVRFEVGRTPPLKNFRLSSWEFSLLLWDFEWTCPAWHFHLIILCFIFAKSSFRGKKRRFKVFFTTNDPFFIYSSSRSEPSSSLFRVSIIIIMRPFLRELAKVSGVCIRPFV